MSNQRGRCAKCDAPCDRPTSNYCHDCSLISSLASIRKSKSLPLLRIRVGGWSDARLAAELQWLRQQTVLLTTEKKLRRMQSSTKAAHA